MPRGSLGLSKSHNKSSSNKKSNTPNITPVSSSSQVIHHNHQIESPGFFSNMWQGFGLGAGQAIAHNIFRSDPVVHVQNDTKSTTMNEYEKCLKDTYNDKEKCKEILERI